MSLYLPDRETNSPWLPISTTLPLSMTIILSASLTDPSLWVTIMAVLSDAILAKPSYILFSSSGSMAAVGSSRTIRLWGLKKPLAIATLCHWPSEISLPPSSRYVGMKYLSLHLYTL